MPEEPGVCHRAQMFRDRRDFVDLARIGVVTVEGKRDATAELLHVLLTVGKQFRSSTAVPISPASTSCLENSA